LRTRTPLLTALGASLLCAGTLSTPAAADESTPDQSDPVEVEGARHLDDVMPAPAETNPDQDANFWLSPVTQIRTTADSDAAQVGTYLAKQLRPSTGYPLPV